MEDLIIDILGDLGEYMLIAAVGLVAFIAAQIYFNQYKDAIFDMLRGSLKDYPTVKTVLMTAVQKNGEAVKCYINGTHYIATRFLGMNTSGNTTQGAVEIRKTTRTLTAEEMQREGLLRDIRNGNLSAGERQHLSGMTEADLLELGLIPEKVAKGKRLIDKNGKVVGAARICTEQEVLELRNSA